MSLRKQSYLVHLPTPLRSFEAEDASLDNNKEYIWSWDCI